VGARGPGLAVGGAFAPFFTFLRQFSFGSSRCLVCPTRLGARQSAAAFANSADDVTRKGRPPGRLPSPVYSLWLLLGLCADLLEESHRVEELVALLEGVEGIHVLASGLDHLFCGHCVGG